MALLKAFFDASRTQIQTGAYVIGGYLASEPFWTAFEADWQKELDYWQIADFHLTDCLSGHEQFDRPGFDSIKRGDCAKTFAQVIVKHRPDAIWSGVIDEDWAALEASPAFRKRYRSPYQFLFHDILWQLGGWGRNHAHGEMIAPVFDTDAPPATVAEIYAELKRNPFYETLAPSVTFGSRKKFIPLQAADLLAGEMQKHWFEREYPKDPTLKFPVWRELLVYSTPHGNMGGLWTPQTLAWATEGFDRTGDPFNWSQNAPPPLPGQSA